MVPLLSATTNPFARMSFGGTLSVEVPAMTADGTIETWPGYCSLMIATLPVLACASAGTGVRRPLIWSVTGSREEIGPLRPELIRESAARAGAIGKLRVEMEGVAVGSLVTDR